jgi:3'-phosphoadenosine 5'-phosphosulfate sulfotransferase (PAPS reductase)/FAD synthetase
VPLKLRDRVRSPIFEAHSIILRAVEKYRPVRAYALFSGGHDSLCAAHVAAAVLADTPLWGGCVHVNTGIGVEQTRQFVRDTCARQGWPLREMHPPVSYEEVVLRWGFPGPAGHTLVYNRLKERCLRRLVRETKSAYGRSQSWARRKQSRYDQVMLVTGVRRQESARRMGYIVPHQTEGSRLWVAPLVDWTEEDKRAYLAGCALPRNDVCDVLCMSGECCCGAFARPGEIKMLEQFYPDTARHIHALERKAEAAGVHAVWGTRPPGNRRPAGTTTTDQQRLPLCWSCESRQEKATVDTPLLVNGHEVRGSGA